MKKQTILLLTALLSTAPLLAQYSPCYEAAFAEGKRLFEDKKYPEAKKYFNEAKNCPDPNTKEVIELLAKCDKAKDEAEKGKSGSNNEKPTSSNTSNKNRKQKSKNSGVDDNWLHPTQQKKKIGPNHFQVYGKWGYEGRGGVMKIDYQFDKAREFKEDLAAVELFDRGWGFIDRKGSYVVEPCFNEVGDFYEGRAWVRVLLRWSYHCTDTVYEVKTDFDASYNWKYGFIDQKGEFTITPRFEEAGNYYHGYAAVKTNGKWGYIDKNGEMVIQPVYDKVDGFWREDELAQVQLYGKWGYVDKSGDLVIEPRFD